MYTILRYGIRRHALNKKVKMTQQFEEKELKNLSAVLHLVCHKWRPLAIQLDVREVDIIEKNHPSDVERCMEDTLRRWLKSGNATAEGLAEGLDRIDQAGLAREIRKKYNLQPTGERAAIGCWWNYFGQRVYFGPDHVRWAAVQCLLVIAPTGTLVYNV